MSQSIKLNKINVTFGQIILALCIFAAILGKSALGQEPERATATSFCSSDDAVEMIRQQIGVTKTFDDKEKRIAALIRASDLLWPYYQGEARRAFTEAFDLSTEYFKESRDEPRREGRHRVQDPDQRYAVITAIARRDPAWAQRLSSEILRDEAREAEEKVTRDRQADEMTGEKLLSVASALLSSDQSSALGFATNSLRYPATVRLPDFLYKLVQANKGSADEFYRAALATYANAPMDQFLYLSSYPFGNDREAGEMPSFYGYQVPVTFVPNPALQRLFVQTLLRRARQMNENATQTGSGSRLTEAGQIWIALTRLQPQIEASLPQITAELQQAKGNLFSLLSQTDRQRVDRMLVDPPKKSFDELVEAADRQKNAAMREQLLAFAVLGAANSEGLERLLSVIEKIDDSDLRDKLVNHLYFERAQQAINNKKLEDARKLAAKIKELDERAYMYSKIVEELMNRTTNDTEVRELLEEVAAEALKAPDTEVKARTLLSLAYLYTRVDLNRSVALLGDAARCINRIDSSNLVSRDYVIKRIEGKSFGSYVTLRTPGFNPQNSFREIGKYDFAGALYQASNFNNKPLRVLVTLELADLCLQQTDRQPKSKKSKKRAGE